jgi:hypothetical protein
MGMTRDQLLQQEQALRLEQARADDSLSAWGIRAPAPAPDGTLDYGDRYQRKLLRMARDHLPVNHKLCITGIDKRMPMDIVEAWKPQIYAACKATALSNDSVPPGEMRQVETRDPNGMKIISFYGQRSFIHDFTRPGRRVTSFRTPNGYVDAAGRPLR